MRVDLHILKPNTIHDFTVDPIDQETVDKLRQSIKNHGFWGGVVCRRLANGTIQIGAGHHRVQAALEEGFIEADVSVQDDRDDAWMVSVYAGENSTQRGSNGIAEAGSVAAAVRWLAKAILTGRCQQLLTPKSVEQLRSNIVFERGLGERAIEEFLSDVPGVQTRTIREQLANLKASGDYARIISEVADEVRRDHPDVDAAKTADQAAAQAQEHYGARTFDFAGVTQYLRNSHQIEVFRKLATGKGLKDALPVENQALLTKHIVEVSKARNNAEVSGAFIRENVMSLLLGAQGIARKLEREVQERLQEEDTRMRVRQSMHNISRSFRLIAAEWIKLERQARDFPEAFVMLAEAGELQRALRAAKKAINELNERVCP
jgi:VCBS repeat-containing protein